MKKHILVPLVSVIMLLLGCSRDSAEGMGNASGAASSTAVVPATAPSGSQFGAGHAARSPEHNSRTVDAGQASASLEYKLATINAGTYVSENDITVARFRSLLNQLSSTYVEDRLTIAEMSVKAQQLLKREGIEESLLNIMEGMNQLLAGRLENQRYAEYVSMYVVLRTKGQSHSEAIRGLQGILRAMGV